jgi:hypothetical protein
MHLGEVGAVVVLSNGVWLLVVVDVLSGEGRGRRRMVII